jgi:N-acetylmuramoyl-L-alanine amidase
MLDPGHGGTDPGAEGVGGAREKDVVLRVARALGAQLEAAGYRVLFTRASDVFLSLSERAAHANTARADLFVSIHANASERPEASGVETYYLSNSDDRATIRLAQMENHLGHMTGHGGRGDDVSFILSDLIQKYKVEESRRLAQRLQSALVAAVRRAHPEVRDLGVKPGPFYVLVGVSMPAVLVELSFLTHRREGMLLGTAEYQQALADGLLSGVTNFVDNEWVASTL